MWHAQLQRRLPAERARHQKRLPYLYGYGEEVNTGDGSESFILTAPVTITEIIRPAPSPQPTASNLIASSSKQTTDVSTSTEPSSLASTPSAQPATSVTVPPLLSTEDTLSSTSSSATPSSPVGSNGQGENSTLPVPNSSSALGSRSLPTGAIVGIVIAAVLLLLGLVIFLVRKRFVQNRQKRTFNWKSGLFNKRFTGNPKTQSSFVEAAENFLPGRYTAGDGEVSPGFKFARAQTEALAKLPSVSTPLAPPPMSYNNNNNPALIAAAGLNTPRAGGVVAPALLPPNGANVKCTFIPTLPDELSISTGEVVRVLAEFDDGWGLCVNGRGEQGMVPLECLDRGFASQEQQDGRDLRNSRRASSLTASMNPGRRY